MISQVKGEFQPHQDLLSIFRVRLNNPTIRLFVNLKRLVLLRAHHAHELTHHDHLRPILPQQGIRLNRHPVQQCAYSDLVINQMKNYIFIF